VWPTSPFLMGRAPSSAHGHVTRSLESSGLFRQLLNGFLNFAASETPGANPNAFGLTVDQSPDWLEVGLEGPFGFIIGVTDIMAGLATFATEIACKCHEHTPLSSQIEP
jgi:hypothetical protein